MYIERLSVVSCASATFLLASFLVFAQPRPFVRQQDENRPEFPFEVKYEKKTGLGGPTWTALILLPEHHYTRENLSSLFRFYSKRHPNKQERLIVNVSVSAGAKELKAHPVRPTPTTSKSPQPDASFYRQGDGAASGGGDNEWYTYAPDLNKPDERKAVVLKGGRGLGPKRVLETWVGSVGSSEIRLRSYELDHVEPKGVYYTFDNGGSDYDDRGGIMTIRLDQRIPLSTERVRVVNEHVTYFFLGWKYAVTLDEGRAWAVWDGEDDASMCGHIEEVSVSPDGVGRMAYRLADGRAGLVRRFHTRDFGQHWILD